jgi:uncharacterized protein YkwD
MMLGGIGAYAIGTASSPQQPSGYAGAIPLPTGTAAAATPQQASTPPQPPSEAAIAAAPVSPPATAGGAGQPESQAGRTGHARQSAGTEDYAQAVFAALNRGRAGQHLPPLAWDARLQASAHSHNRAMAVANTLSHQVDAEPSLGSRESAAGVRWTYAAENIGWTIERSLAGVLDIEARMLTEAPPNDAHRRNILSRQAQAVGIDVYFDAAHGRLWLTEDFSGS